MSRPRILITDHPWPALEIETGLANAADCDLVSGPMVAGDAAQIEALVAEHDPIAIMTCWSPVSAQAIAMPSTLRVVARLGVGLDNIAVDAATKRGAWVTNVPDYCVEEVSDHAIAMLLNHARGICAFDRESKQGQWNSAAANLSRVRNLVIGIIGFGRIGKLTAQKLSQGFGCRVLVTAPSLRDFSSNLELELAENIFASSIEAIQREADVIILHLPLNSSSQSMINDEFIRACVRRPLLINVSRGGLIDNDALIRGLDEKLLRGAALDVVAGEPHPPLSVIGRSDVIATPHIAFTSATSLAELRRRCTEDVIRVLNGAPPVHACNKF